MTVSTGQNSQLKESKDMESEGPLAQGILPQDVTGLRTPFLTFNRLKGNQPLQPDLNLNAQLQPNSSRLRQQKALGMKVRKRDGSLEDVDVNKIVFAVASCCDGLNEVDSMRVATKAISGIYDGATTKELDKLCIQTSAMLISEEPEYSKLGARLLTRYVAEEVHMQKIYLFSHSIEKGHQFGIFSDQLADFVSRHSTELDLAIDHRRNDLFEYFGIRTLYDRYLVKNPSTRDVIETPQYFFMRVACGLAKSVEEAIEFYRLISSLDYMPSSPTLFNSGTCHSQLSSCYLLDSPQDELMAIYRKYMDIAQLSKFAGGIGVAFHRVRSRGSLIKGTNGLSNGIVPWLKTLDSSVCAVNQGGKRKGAACVYLETWHADLEEFLELRDNTGDEARRTHNINLANWVPDLFMKRVEEDGLWSLFDPKEVPHFPDLFGEEFEKAYLEAEKRKIYAKQVKARQLYSRMMKTLAQTGNGWMTFKDTSNRLCNQTLNNRNRVHLSNLCTEILEVTSEQESAVCNLGSVNLSQHVVNGNFSFEKLRNTVKTAIKYLDRVVDINFYPISAAASSNSRWRPVGLGVMGLQDALFKLGFAFDSAEAMELSARIQEEIYLSAMETSCHLARQHGPHPAFLETRAAKGKFQFDLWEVEPSQSDRWKQVKKEVAEFGLRNSLMIAIAPTATIASIVGCYEAIEPQVSNLFKRETLSGEFIQINRYLVQALKQKKLWSKGMSEKLMAAGGSIQQIEEVPAELKSLFRTAWELPMKSLIDMAAARGPYIDQSQSLNLFMESPNIGKLSSMYMYAWKKGLKTTYYLRSRPATSIAQNRDSSESKESWGSRASLEEATAAVTCSLENPEACESCQ